MNRILLFSHTTGYQLRAFNDAADALGIELVFATDRCKRLDDPWRDRAIPVRFFDIEGSLSAIQRHAREFPVDGIIAVGDRPVVLAAHAAESLGIQWHSPDGAAASSDKRRARQLLAASGLPAPQFSVVSVSSAPSTRHDPRATTPAPQFPVVLKPVGLSGSRGVIRADNPREYTAAFERIRALLARPQVRAARTGLEDEILVEEYVDGAEFAIEGVMTAGALRVFAIFDKPVRLEGPFFEETIYVTPSRLAEESQQRLVDHVQRAARALGLQHGPIHAECRMTADNEVYVLEVAARPIGGLCSRVLTFGDDVPLESVLLQHALGQPIDGYTREAQAAAVMMIPIPRGGMFKGVSGEDAARAVDGVTAIHITAKRGQLLEPLPEAGSYLGFIFARATTNRAAEGAVRAAHARL